MTGKVGREGVGAVPSRDAGPADGAERPPAAGPPRAVTAAAPRSPGTGRGPYEPHPLLRGFHRMTLASILARRDDRQPVPRVERRVVAVDHRTSVLTLCSWQPDPAASVVVVVHGLGGHADRPYMRGVARQAFRAGFSVVRLNVRNAGGTESLAGSLYHAGLVEDLRAVVSELVRELPGRKLHLVGFSMGGNMVLRLAGLWADLPPREVVSLCAVSPSVDLERCARDIDNAWGLAVYRRSFLSRLRALYDRRAVLQPERYEAGRVAGARTLRVFDELATAPDCGFPDAATYYRRASARPVLRRIALPTLVLHARDDLLTPLDGGLEDELRSLETVSLEVSPHGGHCAFLCRDVLGPGGDRSWAEHRLVAFLVDREAGCTNS